MTSRSSLSDSRAESRLRGLAGRLGQGAGRGLGGVSARGQGVRTGDDGLQRVRLGAYSGRRVGDCGEGDTAGRGWRREGRRAAEIQATAARAGLTEATRMATLATEAQATHWHSEERAAVETARA